MSASKTAPFFSFDDPNTGPDPRSDTRTGSRSETGLKTGPITDTKAKETGPEGDALTVSGLASAIKRLVEGKFGYVRLRGEISGYRGPHSSGHCYFSLKDEKARIDAVIWRGVFSKLKFKPEEGLEVIATGKVSTFAGKSSYQIMITALEPAGAGALMALLEERKRKLAAEGVFDDDRKRPLPFLPRVIGIVTSPTGAVIRDMMHGFHERFPSHVIVWPVRVQGETSGNEVAAAINGFNAIGPQSPMPRPDVLIVARGGGSLEDLWGFNDEAVVRAVAASQIPLISAVGHESDWTLIDLVADARAPTPTKAAEWAVPKHSELLERVDDQTRRLHISLRRTLEERRSSLTAATRGLPRLTDLLAMPRQRFDTAAMRLSMGLRGYTQARRAKFEIQRARLQPAAILNRAGQARERLAALGDRNIRALTALAQNRRARFQDQALKLQPVALSQRLDQSRERLGSFAARGKQAFGGRVGRFRLELDGQGKLLKTLSHYSVLDRGFALVRGGDGQMLRRAAGVSSGAGLDLEFADGHIRAEALGDAVPGSKTGVGRRRAVKKPKKKFDPGGQGSLF